MSLDQTILTVVWEREPQNLMALIRGVRQEMSPRFVGLTHIFDHLKRLVRNGYIKRDEVPNKYGGRKPGPYQITERGLEVLDI